MSGISLQMSSLPAVLLAHLGLERWPLFLINKDFTKEPDDSMVAAFYALLFIFFWDILLYYENLCGMLGMQKLEIYKSTSLKLMLSQKERQKRFV